jgi:hypothetical protein
MAKKKSRKTKPKAKVNHKPVKKSPRQEALPGLEDRAIKAIDNAAMDYADIRDQRQALTAQESSLKTELLNLMHKHQKTHYKHGTVEINVVPEAETIKVRIKEENEQKPDDTQPEAVTDAESENDVEVYDTGENDLDDLEAEAS